MKKRTLRWRRIPDEDLGFSRRNAVTLFDASPDPFVASVIELQAGPLTAFLGGVREATGKKITITQAMNKILGLAIEENPSFNQVVVGGRVYQLEDVSITNLYLLPDEGRTLTSFLIDNPQRMSLVNLRDAFAEQILAWNERFQKSKDVYRKVLPRWYISTGFYKLIPERVRFRMVWERGLATNWVVSNASAGGSARYLVTKSAVQIQRNFTRAFVHSVRPQVAVEDGKVVAKDIIPLTLVFDHRVVDGAHLAGFVASLEKITADPERYLAG